MREQRWHCQSQLRGLVGGVGSARFRVPLALYALLTARLGGGESGSCGLKGEGGMASLDER